jgi:streptogramin lyase
MVALVLVAGVFVRAGQQGQGQTPSPFPLSQSIRERGSSVTGAYEGWYRNKDGSISLLVGYFNRNTKQELDIPVGPNNRIEPGGPDQGQPTHFLTSRQWGVFSIKAPADLGAKKITWTLVANGQTNVVTLHTLPEWELEPFEDSASKNTPPAVRLQPNGPVFAGPPAGFAATLTAMQSAPLPLEVWASDEPPKLAVASALLVAPASGRGRGGASAVSVGWSVFRGPGPVVFENARPRVDPASEGKATTTATFSVPGDYVLRLQANDSSGDGGGGFQCCWTNVLITVGVKPAAASAQTAAASSAPINTAPNPYRTVENWAKLPEGRMWGSLSAVEVDKDGKSIWVADRCGGNSACLESPTVDPIFHFDASGRLLKSFGAGLIVSPHGIHVDRDGNVWITDYQDNAPRPAGGARGRGGALDAAQARPVGQLAGATKGHQVFKFSSDGKLLMTLGDAGGGADPQYFFQPNDVVVATNGDIFVSQGHGQGKSEILKFSKDGKLVKRFGQTGTAPGEFDQPHALAFDSKGRLFVGDRNNNRIQILDQNGTFLDQWTAFSRPSGIFIDARDNIYVADSESESVARNHPGWKRGIRIGKAADGKVLAFIPDPNETATGTSAAEGVAADAEGNVYGAEVGPRALKKYVRK